MRHQLLSELGSISSKVTEICLDSSAGGGIKKNPIIRPYGLSRGLMNEVRLGFSEEISTEKKTWKIFFKNGAEFLDELNFMQSRQRSRKKKKLLIVPCFILGHGQRQ